MGQPAMFTHASDTLFDEEGNIDARSADFLARWMVQFVHQVKWHIPPQRSAAFA